MAEFMCEPVCGSVLCIIICLRMNVCIKIQDNNIRNKSKTNKNN